MPRVKYFCSTCGSEHETEVGALKCEEHHKMEEFQKKENEKKEKEFIQEGIDKYNKFLEWLKQAQDGGKRVRFSFDEAGLVKGITRHERENSLRNANEDLFQYIYKSLGL